VILTRKENNASAIEAWEKSIKIQPSADAYTSKPSYLFYKTPRLLPVHSSSVEGADDRYGFSIRNGPTTKPSSSY